MSQFPQKGLKSPDRPRPRKASKSPINIRRKIKELENHLDKHSKPHQIPYHNLPPSTTTPRLTPQPAVKHPPIKTIKREEDKASSSNFRLNPDRFQQRRIQSHGRNTHARQAEPVPKTTPRWNSQDPQNRLRKTVAEHSCQNLERLKDENLKYREIYLKSVQKIQDLEDKLMELRVHQQNEKNSLEATYQILQSRIETAKKPLAHIYSFEDKNNDLIAMEENIIAETDNQNSSHFHQGQFARQRSKSFSALSLQSK